MKDHVFTILEKLMLPPGEFVVTGSAVLAVRGVRCFRDIDIILTEDAYQMLKRDERWQVIKRRKGFEVVVTEVDGVEIEANPYMHTWHEYTPDRKDIFQCAEDINNIPFMCLEHLISVRRI